MRFLLILALLCTHALTFAQNSYEKAWQAINTKDWAAADKLLTEASKDSRLYEDAYITAFYLNDYLGKKTTGDTYYNEFYQKSADPFPYTFGLWFNESVAGPTGKKENSGQVKFLQTLLNDKRTPGTLLASANYQLGMHNLCIAKFDNVQPFFSKVGNIRNWQLVGPFENLSQSGFDKQYGPISHPEADAVFYSHTNAPIRWFTPATETAEGWTPVCFSITEETAVVYAQTFLESDKDQSVYFNLGVSGSAKVWINDQLIISEATERVTEFDAYRVPCSLKKGGNRILVQLGYSNNSYPNFAVRITDKQGIPIPGLQGTTKQMTYGKAPSATGLQPQITGFAEQFFRERITKDPANMVNYMLLTDVYMRYNRVIEARTLMTTALAAWPENCLLIMKMIEVLLKENNRTLLLEEVEKIKALDPESLLVIELNIKEFYDNEKYEECAAALASRVAKYGEDFSSANYHLLLLNADKKYDELVAEVERMYKAYPGNATLVPMMYSVKKEVYKDKKAAMRVYEDYLKENYNYENLIRYKNLLKEEGEHSKARKISEQIQQLFPYSPSEFTIASNDYFSEKQFANAEKEINRAIALAPYSETYWAKLGDIRQEMKKTDEAIGAYRQSLMYNPNQYDIISKVRKLNNKTELLKQLYEAPIDSLVKADKISEAKNVDYGWYYILDQKDVLCYPGGATEQYYTMLIRITNQKGIDQYKESSIGYGNGQSLLIEKAELIKKNSSHIKGEVNDNQVVFTKLEEGDVVVFKYRLRDYYYGRMSREFWDNHWFGGQIYSATVRYNLLMPSDTKIYYNVRNSDLKPTVEKLDEFTRYTWLSRNIEPDLDEPLMPVLSDVTQMLQISTIPDWKDIVDWYADIASNRAEEDFEIIQQYNKLFPAGEKKLTQLEKARRIYDFIEANISYSSVAFRQSGYVPQRPVKTLTTKLGDCKDLSSLFVTLARMAGINSQLVLTNTRDNGEKSLQLPSMEFNHCIVKAELDSKVYYIELTDNYLPFASLPNNDLGAAILEIPQRSAPAPANLKKLVTDTRTRDILKRTIDMVPAGLDMDVTVTSHITGAPTANTRYTFRDLDEDKQIKKLQEMVASRYRNVVNISSVKFGDLTGGADTVGFTYRYKVKNEIAEIGSMKTFRINYPDVVASLDHFSADKRVYPVNYMAYEEVDSYDNVINISAPAGSRFIEIPSNQILTFGKMKFSITYTLKSPSRLVVTRKFTSSRETIPASDYAELKTFFEKIVKAEGVFITYK